MIETIDTKGSSAVESLTYEPGKGARLTVTLTNGRGTWAYLNVRRSEVEALKASDSIGRAVGALMKQYGQRADADGKGRRFGAEGKDRRYYRIS